MDDIWDIMGNICEKAHDNLWACVRSICEGPKHGECLGNIYGKYLCGFYIGKIGGSPISWRIFE